METITKTNIKSVIGRNEATIQAEIYRLLMNINIKCYLEIKIQNPKRRLNSIVDIVVVDNNEDIVYLIEVKPKPKTLNPKKKTTIQVDRYIEISEYYDIPFIYCYGYEEIEKTINAIQTCFTDKIVCRINT